MKQLSMFAALSAAALLAPCTTAHARTKALENGTSPNRQFRVQVSGGDSAAITYEIVTASNSAILHRVVSSYQPEEGEMPDWAWNHANAEIHWSSDSHYVVIDEQVHRYIGKVFIISVGPRGARTINVPEKEIFACTKLKWDRYHIRVGDGWSSDRSLSLSLAGSVPSGALPDGRSTFMQRTFNIRLRIHGRSAVITSCREIMKET